MSPIVLNREFSASRAAGPVPLTVPHPRPAGRHGRDQVDAVAARAGGSGPPGGPPAGRHATPRARPPPRRRTSSSSGRSGTATGARSERLVGADHRQQAGPAGPRRPEPAGSRGRGHGLRPRAVTGMPDPRGERRPRRAAGTLAAAPAIGVADRPHERADRRSGRGASPRAGSDPGGSRASDLAGRRPGTAGGAGCAPPRSPQAFRRDRSAYAAPSGPGTGSPAAQARPGGGRAGGT